MARRWRSSSDQTLAFRTASPRSAALVEIVGEDPAFRRAVDLAQRFASRSLPILVVGATGTGKEVFAQAIYRWSGRKGPLIDVTCGGLPSGIMESELFGHRRGAFTGAVGDTPGLIGAADRGILFLDELEVLPTAAQQKLLRVLEGAPVRQVGAVSSRRVDLRVVSAAQPELWDHAQTGRFRRDLLHRLAGIVIELPDLKNRGQDIVILAREFAAEFGRELGPAVAHVLLTHDWPGNVRELRLVIERASYLGSTPDLNAGDVREAMAHGGHIDEQLRSGQRHNGSAGLGREELLELCSQYEWKISEVAAAAGVSRATLYRRLVAAGISVEASRKAAALTISDTGENQKR